MATEAELERFLKLLTEGTGIERTVDTRLAHAARFRSQQAVDQVGYDYVDPETSGIPHPTANERRHRLGWPSGWGTAELATWNYVFLDPVQAAVDHTLTNGTKIGLLNSPAHMAILGDPIWTHWGAGIHSVFKPGDPTDSPILMRHYFLIWLSIGVPPVKVIVYNNDATVDALNASYLASKYASPLFPINKSSIPPQVRDELVARDPQEILIIGGTGVVDATAEAALAKLAPVRRIAGATRYDTAVAISHA